LLNLQPNCLLNLAKIDQGLNSIRETYLMLGYLDVQVNSSLEPVPGRAIADLLVNLQEGTQYRIGKIEMAGSLPVPTPMLLEFFPLQKGDIFGEKVFNYALNALNSLGMTPKLTVQDVDFSIDRNRGVVDLMVHLTGRSLGKK
jgi:outer membrane protein assembly factor BamA